MKDKTFHPILQESTIWEAENSGRKTKKGITCENGENWDVGRW